MSLAPRLASSTTVSNHPSSSLWPSAARTKSGSLGVRPGPGLHDAVSSRARSNFSTPTGSASACPAVRPVRSARGQSRPGGDRSPGGLEGIAVAKHGALAEGVHPWVLDGAFVDLCAFDPVAHDPPALQHAQGPADARERQTGRRRPPTPRGRRAVRALARRSSRRRARSPPRPRPRRRHRARGSRGRDRAVSIARRPPSRPPPRPPRRPGRHATHHADPTLGSGHPAEGNGAREHRRHGRQAGGRRLNEDDVVAVTPMSCCQVARSNSTDWAERNAPGASHSPMRRKMPSRSSTSPHRLRGCRHRRRTAPGRHRRPAGGRARRSGRSARRRTLRAPRSASTAGDPGFGEGEDRSRVPEDAGIGSGLLPLVPDGLAVPDLHGVQGPGRLVGPSPAPPPPASPSPPSSPPRIAPAHPHGHAGPTRNRVPCRSGGSEPDIGRRSAPLDPDHRAIRSSRDHGRETHAADQPTCVWQSRGMPTLSEDLTFRGLIHQMTDADLPKRFDQPGLTVYAGFDPTADSLHVGNLMQLCTLRRFQEAGHRTISLAGGGHRHDRRPRRQAGRASAAQPRDHRGLPGGDPPPARPIPRPPTGPSCSTTPTGSARCPPSSTCAMWASTSRSTRWWPRSRSRRGSSVRIRGSPTRSSATCCCRPTTSCGSMSTTAATCSSAAATSGATSPWASTTSAGSVATRSGASPRR